MLRDSGVKPSTYNRYLNEESEASAEKLARLAEATGVSLDWLLLDRGTPIFETGSAPQPLPNGPDMATIPRCRVFDPEPLGPTDERILFPRLLLRRLGVPVGELEFLRTEGDAMSPTIADGALVLIDRSRRQIDADAIYVVSLDDGPLIRRVRRNVDGAISLILDNRMRYDPERLDRVDAGRLRVHGRVCWTETIL